MPSLFVVVSIEAPDGVVSNTVAPTSAAPDGSVTWPRIVPVWFCGRHGNAISNMIRRSKTPLRPDFCAAFIRITEKFRSSAISIVALALLRRVSSAIAQAPRSQNTRCLFLCRRLQQSFHPAQDSDGRNLRVFRSTGGDDHPPVLPLAQGSLPLLECLPPHPSSASQSSAPFEAATCAVAIPNSPSRPPT